MQPTAAYKEMLNKTGFILLNKIVSTYCTWETSMTKTVFDHICTNIKKYDICNIWLQASLLGSSEI